MEGLAREAQVSKQTIYRWWPSPASVLLEAAIETADQQSATPLSGNPVKDVERFIAATFRAASLSPLLHVLRAIASEAQRDQAALEVFQGFTARRRQLLRERLQIAVESGVELPGGDIEAAIDTVFGALWYRLLVRHRMPTPQYARSVSRQILGTSSSVRSNVGNG
jgi:AcrR family transcriptional regulator